MSSSRQSTALAPARWSPGRSIVSRWAASAGVEAQALSDYLLALRALLDATSQAGQASMSLRLAALCAEEHSRRDVQHRLEAALALSASLWAAATGVRLDAESPRELVAEAEGHLRALLRDVLCGYLDADLKGVADDILLESGPEPFMEAEAHRDRGAGHAQGAAFRARAGGAAVPGFRAGRRVRARAGHRRAGGGHDRAGGGHGRAGGGRGRPRARAARAGRSDAVRRLRLDDPEDFSAPV